jgi:hypothetical protein
VKQFYVTLLLLGTCYSSSAMQKTIYIPSHNLRTRLSTHGFNGIVEQTNIIQYLTDEAITPLKIVELTTHAIEHYSKRNSPITNAVMRERKTELITVILQDHPAIIKQLTNSGILAESPYF